MFIKYASIFCFITVFSINFFRYLQQFQDLYTEEGRKSVKIMSYIPTQQAMIQAQSKPNRVKTESNRSLSSCQGPDNKTTVANGTNVKTHSNVSKMMVNAVVKNDGNTVTSQSISGKLPLYNTSNLSASTSSIVMTGTNTNLAGLTVQGTIYLL